MQPRSTILSLVVAVGAGCASLLGTVALRAQDAGSGCTRVTVTEAPELAAPWRDATQKLREQLASLQPTECIALALEISPVGGGAKVVAVRPDGLRAERRVPRPSSLGAIVLGLVASLPTPEEADASTLDAAGLALADPADGGAPADVSSPVPPPRATPPPPLPPGPVVLDVGLSAGARLGEPTRIVMVDTELRIDVLVRHWLLLGAFRYAPTAISVGPTDVAYEDFSLALGVGGRTTFGRLAFDVALCPTLAFTSMDNDVVTGAGTQFRLGASARVLVPLTAAVGFAFTVDGEMVPSHLSKPLRVDPALPPLPSWTLGARVGIVGQLL